MRRKPRAGSLKELALQRAGILDIDWSELGAYIYAYYRPQRPMRPGEVPPDGPALPFYIGKGHGDRALYHVKEALRANHDHTTKLSTIAEILDCDAATQYPSDAFPTIRILAHNLEATDSEDQTAFFIETTLLGLFGREHRSEFEERMGFPNVLSNKLASSTPAIRSMSLMNASATFSHSRKAMVTDDLVDAALGSAGVEHARFVSLGESFDDRAEEPQLRVVTTEWWSPGPARFPAEPFVLLGWKSKLGDPTIAVIRSAYLVDPSLGTVNEYGRWSFHAGATFVPELWQAVVGHAITHDPGQLEGVSYGRTEPTLTVQDVHKTLWAD